MVRGDTEKAERELHRKYGPLVRTAPHEVSCSDPAAVPIIYRERNPLPKTPWYLVFRSRGISDQPDLFSDRSEANHARNRKIIGPVYQMGMVLKNEPSMDESINLFVKRMHQFAARKESIDFGHWIELFAYDVIGRVQHGRTTGFLETGTDIGGMISAVPNALRLLHVVAAGPKYMVIPIMTLAMMVPSTAQHFKAVGRTVELAKQITEERMKERNEVTMKQYDIMSQLFVIMRERGSDVGFAHSEITLEAWSGIMAGADSTASTMRATFYYLMKRPALLAKAVAEVRDAETRGLLSTPIQYVEATSHLPYICACIKESTRLFPSFAVRLSRVSPTEGLELCGYYIPSGYWAGMNAAVVQYDKSLFGSDADDFNPERWLESQERSFAMEKGMLVFGAGTRTCIGKNIALSEMYKAIAEILRRFDMEMAHQREWKTCNAGFVTQSDVIVNLTARE
ncbi:pisatin demethylase [Phaeosphaeriaceae sp. PMI808]|nr:pisatin demethylase [Phaeosphaeriaceae sp. PMI808]